MNSESINISKFKTARTFLKRGTCSETLMAALNQAYGHPMEPEEHAATPLAGGIASQGYQCGMLWGACLAAGAEAYRIYGATPKAEAAAVLASQKLVESLRSREGDINCLEITDTDWNNNWQIAKFFLKGGTISCMRRVLGYTADALNVINNALADVPDHLPPGPASCAAEMARKTGASDRHVVMAAGLAGGIGLSGGACGALGAAIWLGALKNEEKPTGFSLMTPGVTSRIDQFLKASDHEYECKEIAGRTFTSIDDHAIMYALEDARKFSKRWLLPIKIVISKNTTKPRLSKTSLAVEGVGA